MIVEVAGRRRVKMFADQQRQLVRVLNDGRYTRASAPVVVEMRVLVRQHLQLIRRESAVVVDDVVAGGRDGALADGLADQVEVETEEKKLFLGWQ